MSNTTLSQILREWRAQRDQERLIEHAEYTIKHHLHRAEKLGLPATLTLVQWQATVEYFQKKCAYCQETHCQVLEHFIPLELGGGTTADNCVPACRRCNSAKGPYDPFNLPFQRSPGSRRVMQGIERVYIYLQTRRSEVAV